MNGAPDIAQLLQDIVTDLETFLDPSPGSLPSPAASIAGVVERPLGLGNLRGYERQGSLGTIALRGGRLDLQVRFTLWENGPVEVDLLVDELNGRLLAARADLFNDGYLRITPAGSPPAEPIASLNAWRRTTDFAILYEFHYVDSDDAESLIARIPIHADPEETPSPERETAVVTDALVRWDNLNAPALVVRGRHTVTDLAALAFVPGPAPGGTVTLQRTFDGAPAPPTDYPSLGAWITAVAGDNPTERNGRIIFPSLTDFLNALPSDGDPLPLGDWDEDNVLDSYEPHRLTFSPAIVLFSGDRLELLAGTAPLDQTAVIYCQFLPR